MGEPINLINVEGEAVTTYSRFEAAAMVASGDYARRDGGSDDLEAVFEESVDLDNLGIVVEVDDLAGVGDDEFDIVAGRLAAVDDFTVVEGINEEIQAALENAGVISWEIVAEWGANRLIKDVAGVGAARAKALVAEAERILE